MTMTAREALRQAAEIANQHKKDCLRLGYPEKARTAATIEDAILALRDSLPQEKVKDHPARIEASGHEASVQNDAEAQELPAVNSARPAGEPGTELPPKGGKPVPRSSLIRDSAKYHDSAPTINAMPCKLRSEGQWLRLSICHQGDLTLAGCDCFYGHAASARFAP